MYVSPEGILTTAPATVSSDDQVPPSVVAYNLGCHTSGQYLTTDVLVDALKAEAESRYEHPVITAGIPSPYLQNIDSGEDILVADYSGQEAAYVSRSYHINESVECDFVESFIFDRQRLYIFVVVVTNPDVIADTVASVLVQAYLTRPDCSRSNVTQP